MKSRLLLTLVLLILILGMIPAGVVSASEPEVWVLVETQIEPQEKYLGWERQFLDSEMLYTITLTDAEFAYRTRVKKAGVTTVDAFFQFKFDKFPEELVPGDTARLHYTGSSSGTGDVSEKALSLYAQEWTKDDVKKSTLAETRLSLKGTASQDTKTLEFVVPETFDGKLVIQTTNNIAAQAEIRWIYQAGKSKATSTDETAKNPRVISQEEWEEMKEDVARQAPYAATPWITEQLKEGYIGVVFAATGDYDLHDYSGQQMRASKPRMLGDTKIVDVQLIRIGDRIQTGKNGRLRVQLFDWDGTSNTGPSVISMASNSEMYCDGFFGFREQVQQENQSILSLIKGKWRAYIKSKTLESRNAGFRVEAGVAVCGIRGSDVFISYNPDTETVEAYVIEGHMDVTNSETGETKSLTDNQKLLIDNGNISEIQYLGQAEWDSLIEENGLEDMQQLSQEELEQLRNAGRSSAIFIIIGVCVAVVAGLAFLFRDKWLRKMSKTLIGNE